MFTNHMTHIYHLHLYKLALERSLYQIEQVTVYFYTETAPSSNWLLKIYHTFWWARTHCTEHFNVLMNNPINYNAEYIRPCIQKLIFCGGHFCEIHLKWGPYVYDINKDWVTIEHILTRYNITQKRLPHPINFPKLIIFLWARSHRTDT